MPTLRTRREPPAFRRVALRRLVALSPRLERVTFGGDALHGFELGLPAASVRLLLPRLHDTSLVIPDWNGNEFLHSDGERPTIRTYTPRGFDATRAELDIDVVLHEGGAVPKWITSAAPGAEVGISGPGRGYAIDPTATHFVLIGDESALPAISQLIEHLPASATIEIVLEVAHPDARHELPPHRGAAIAWLDLPPSSPPGSMLVTAVEALHLADDTRLWAAGEAAAMQRIRRHLFEERGMSRSQTVVRGYWKTGRAGDRAAD